MAEVLLEQDPRSVPPAYYRDLFYRFLLRYLDLSLIRDGDKIIGAQVEAMDLVAFDPALAFMTFHWPQLLIPLMQEALSEALKQHPEYSKRLPQRQPRDHDLISGMTSVDKTAETEHGHAPGYRAELDVLDLVVHPHLLQVHAAAR